MAGENGDAMRGIYRAAENVRKAVSRAHRFRTGKHEPWYLIDTVDEARYARRLAEVFFEEIVQPPPGANKIGFKELRFFEPVWAAPDLLEFIVETIPHVRIVFNTRDHDAIARSGWYKKQDPREVAERLRRIEQVMHGFVESHPRNAILCCYDDYTKDAGALRPLFDFLGEPFDEGRVQAVLDTPLTRGKPSSA